MGSAFHAPVGAPRRAKAEEVDHGARRVGRVVRRGGVDVESPLGHVGLDAEIPPLEQLLREVGHLRCLLITGLVRRHPEAANDQIELVVGEDDGDRDVVHAGGTMRRGIRGAVERAGA